MKYLQKLGKALMLPVATLPVCAFLMGIGYLLCPATMQGGEMSGFANMLGFFLVKAGGALIDNMPLLFEVQRADAHAHAPAFLEGNLTVIGRMEEACRRIIEEGQCVSLKTLAVKGADLMALGFAPGPKLGGILSQLLEDVLEFPEHNTKEYLLNAARGMKE